MRTCLPTCRCPWWWDLAGRHLPLRGQYWWEWPRCPQSVHCAPSCWWSGSPPETTPAHNQPNQKSLFFFLYMVKTCAICNNPYMKWYNSYFSAFLPTYSIVSGAVCLITSLLCGIQFSIWWRIFFIFESDLQVSLKSSSNHTSINNQLSKFQENVSVFINILG